MRLANKWIGKVQTGLTGLDIGSSSVKLLALQKKSDGWTASAAAYCDIDPAADMEVYEENTVHAINTCFRKAGGTIPRQAVCALSGSEVDIRGFSFPPLPVEAIEQAVRLEAQQLCAIDINHSVIDYQLVQEPEKKEQIGPSVPRKGYFVAGLEDAIDRKMRLTGQAHVKPLYMDAGSLAMLNCICQLFESTSSDSFAVLDIGHSQSTLNILGNNGIPFVRGLSCSGRQILTQLAQKKQATISDLKKLLVQDIASHDHLLETEMKNACSRLVSDIIDTLRFYSIQQNTEKVVRLYLCGGFAVYRPFVRILEDILSLPVKVFNPAESLHCPQDGPIHQAFEEFGPAFTVAAGLAMRSTD